MFVSVSRAFCLCTLALPGLRADDMAARANEILKKNCIACHGPARMSGLDLRTRETLMAGGEKGAAINQYFKAEDSRLYQQVTHAVQPAMPPGKKLTDAELEILRTWIEAGVPYQDTADKSKESEAAELAKLEERPITPEERGHWAYLKPKKVAPPSGQRNPVDAFLFAALRDKGLKPSPAASKRVLIRRAYLDLLGLPPTPAEVEAFVNDTDTGAWPKLVERLLASPHYGERSARHWLDLVRYADSGGFEFDVDRPQAWRYRDYVSSAFNKDKPYDQFIREQIAGDEYTPVTDEAMIATGYLRLGPEGGGGGERGRQDQLDDIITTTSLTFLGLTVGCARCHNHKFDPIPQKDYFRIQSVFYSIRQASHPLVSKEAVAAHSAETQRIGKLQEPLRKAKAALEEPYQQQLVEEAVSKLPEYMQLAWRTPPDKRTEGQTLTVKQIERTLKNDSLSMKLTEEQVVERMSAEDKRKHEDLKAQIKALDEQKPKPYATAMAIGEPGRQARPSYFLHRGSIDVKGSLMKPGVLAVLQEDEWPFPEPPADAKSSWRRRGFAEWVASPGNPLTARVMVNRIWQQHFGEGIVRTPSNFGKLGEAPSHPELLDWLAVEFVERGWSVKAMHRLIMNSQAYQMASDDITANVERDPENRLFWRMPRLRLEAEAIRDSVLAAAGTLDRTFGGPCVYPYINPELFQSSTKRTWPGKPDDDPSTWRRSIYVYSKRSIRYPLFEAYDQPNLVNSCDRRNRSTIAPQALLMMNNSFVLTQARYFAERLRREAGDDLRAQIEHGYRLALGREPSTGERALAVDYISSGKDRLPLFCQALFNLNEFVYRP